MRDYEIAQVCHEANRVLQIIQFDPSIPISPHWEFLDDETIASAVVGVAGIQAGNTPEESHESWVKFKLEHGWTLGPVKDEVAKTHPLLVPYAELPPEQQLKDQLFSAIVQALDGNAGMRVHIVHSQMIEDSNRWVLPLLHWLNGEVEELDFEGMQIPQRLQDLLDRGSR